MSIDRRRTTRQRGSALLIVFLFAAMVAIMLYREMPVVAFEARRQKEQLLVDRANEYKHAVKLYYRKVGGYPASLDQLENTNRMRFLRHRYKDPFTGKDDWRLLHMGPGNMLLDSKVNSLKTGEKSGTAAASTASGFSGNSATGSTSTFGNGLNNSSSFGSNTSGFTGLSSSTSESQPAVKVPAVRQRGPAVPADGGSGAGDLSGDLSADSSIPMPSAVSDEAMPLNEGQAGVQTPQPAGQGNGSQPNNQPPGANATQMVQGLFGSQSPRPGSVGSSRLGAMRGGGGIAGVASKASGQSIKTVDDQSDYSLWEFYYDPSKDVRPGLAGGAQPAASPSGTTAATTGPTTNGTQSNSFSLGNAFGSAGSNQSGNAPGNATSSGRGSGSAQNPPQ